MPKVAVTNRLKHEQSKSRLTRRCEPLNDGDEMRVSIRTARNTEMSKVFICKYHRAISFLLASIVLLVASGTVDGGNLASASSRASSISVVEGTVGKKVFPGWATVVADKAQGDELAVTSAISSNKSSQVGFFAFPTKAKAHAFIEKPPDDATVPIGGRSEIWIFASQEAFANSNKLNNESKVYDSLAEDAVAIFLQQGDVVIVGEYQGAPNNSDGNYNLISVGVSAETEAAADILANKPVPQLAGFSGIDGKALPGLPKTNWPKLTALTKSSLLFAGASSGQTTSSNDLTYEVAIYDFSSVSSETSFYEDKDAQLSYVIPEGAAIARLSGSTGVSGTSEVFNLSECGGSSSVESGNRCSGSISKPFSAGVVTVFERGSTITVIIYLASGLHSATPPPGEVAKNVKIANSVISLLSSVGVS